VPHRLLCWLGIHAWKHTRQSRWLGELRQCKVCGEKGHETYDMCYGGTYWAYGWPWEMYKMNKKWPALFTCPTNAKGLEADDLGETLFNPVFSNRGKLIDSTAEGCGSCDCKDSGECPGPVEYRPA